MRFFLFIYVFTLACGHAPSAVMLPNVPSARATTAPAARAAHPYPNEIVGYQFWGTARWRTLVPLESTLLDVRHVLGEPESADDIANVGPYPGDDAAKQPVLSYRVAAGWHAYVYLVKSDLSVSGHYAESVQGRLLSIDLVADAPTPFVALIPNLISNGFREQQSMGADASWVTYEDGSGLRYEVYTHDLSRGRAHGGDLNRIVYGPSDAARARSQR